MPRTLNPVSHAIRRDAFVEAAQRLIATNGYERLSVQDVIDELGSSKGAFYHYFDSKQALLTAVIETMVAAATATLEPVAHDPDMPALEKMNRFFATLAGWKGERRDLLMEFMKVWLSDDNAIVREKMRQGVSSKLTPLMETIVAQGTAEGVFTPGSPSAAAGVLVAIIVGLNETATRVALARYAGELSYEQVVATFVAYVEAFERILGVAPGSLAFIDEKTLRFWFD